MTEHDYVLGLWYLSGTEKDYLAVAYRRQGEDRFRISHRFRYYAGTQDPFDGTDRKVPYGGIASVDTTEDAIVRTIDEIVDDLVARGFCPSRLPWKLRDRRFKRVVRCDGRKFFEVLLSLPFVHMKAKTTGAAGVTN